MAIFDFIEKHKFGIIGTIAFHILLFIWLNLHLVQLDVYVPKEKVLAVLDFTEEQEDDTPQPEMPQPVDENGNPIESNVMNVAADATQEKTTYTNQANNNFSKSKADQEVWDMLKGIEAEEYAKINAGKESSSSEESSSNDKEHRQIDPSLIKNDAKENNNASFGADIIATANYSLKGRKPLHQDKPSYLCRSEGKVRIIIKVNQKGEVISRTIDEAKTTTQNDCLRTAALQYSKKWKFNQNFSDPMRLEGWIEFTYMAQ